MTAASRIALCMAVIGMVGGPSSAGVPAWAKPIAESAPAVPEGSPEWPSRILFRERRIVVDERGAPWKVVERRAEQVLSNRGSEASVGFFAFNDDTKVKKSKGWHLPPSEHAERNVGGSVDLTMSDSFLTDAKIRAVALVGIKKGSLVFFEFEAERNPYTASESFWWGSAEVPVDRERVVLEAPSGWSLRHAWLRRPGPEPSRGGAGWTFELTGWIPPHDEQLGPDPEDTLPILVVALDPPAGSSEGVAVLADWNGFASWFDGLAKGRDAVDPSIESAAAAALAGAGPEPIDRIRAIARYVRDRVRYLSRAVGIGGYTPASATSTLAGLYGDCKDKGTLLRSLLASSGFTSYPILINATREETVAEEIPDPGSFDHFVVGVRWPSDVPASADLASAMIVHAELGRILVVDTTDEFAWPGTLPAVLAGRRGALIDGARGLLVTMPPGDPSAHRVERQATVTMEPSGAASVTLDVKYIGWPAEAARSAYSRSAVERRKRAEAAARRAWDGAVVQDYRAIPENREGAFVESFALQLAPESAELRDGLLGVFAGATEDLERVPLGKRVAPIVFESPVRLAYATTVTGVSESTPLPRTQEMTGDGWSVRTGLTRDGPTVRGAFTFELSRTRFDPDGFAEAKRMWTALSKATSVAVAIGP